MEIWTWTLNTLLWGCLFYGVLPMNLSQNTAHHSLMAARNFLHMNILVWNIQGAGSREVLNMLCEHLRRYKPSIVVLVKTRISGVKAQAVCDKIGFRNCFRVKAQGFPGGICVLWNFDEIGVAVRDSQE